MEKTYLEVFFAALLIVVLITPLVKKLASAWGVMDAPDERKVHVKPIARMGGLAIFIGFAIVVWLNLYHTVKIIGIIAGASWIVIIGLMDDRWSLPAKIKLVGQIIAAGIVVSAGVRIEEFTNPFGGMVFLSEWSSWLVSIIWIVGFVNIINLIDGLDGLAAGITAIASLTILGVAISYQFFSVAVLTAALAGACIGFLRYNFNPASVFMGDTGSMFLGFMLAVVSILGTAKGVAAIALIVPLLALGVPIADTSLAILRRYLAGQHIFQPDKHHLHHRLLATGLSHRQAVILLYAVSAVMGVAAVAMTVVSRDLAAVILVVLVVLIIAVAIKIGMLPKRS